jgi:hypothetical protein
MAGPATRVAGAAPRSSAGPGLISAVRTATSSILRDTSA